MKRLVSLFFVLVALLTGCGAAGTSEDSGYTHISQEEAKEMMDTQDVLILDVREQEEYDSGHIPDALLPVGDHHRGIRRRDHPGQGHDSSDLLPQRKPQQNCRQDAGRVRVYQYLRVRRDYHLAV